jgi:hypothetical protein
MAHNGLHTGFVEHVADGKQLVAGQGNRLLESHEFRPAFNSGFDKGRAQVGHGAKTKHIRSQGFGQRRRIAALLGISQLRGSVIKTLLVDIANAGHPEAGMSIEGCGMVHAALSHAYHKDGILSHDAFLSLKR